MRTGLNWLSFSDDYDEPCDISDHHKNCFIVDRRCYTMGGGSQLF